MADFDVDLRQHYIAAGLYDGKQATVIADACKCAAFCWAGESDARRPACGSERSHAYLPWIGPHYTATRLVVVGENLYEHGGWEAMRSLVSQAKAYLVEGRRRMNFGVKTYKGTLFYSRAAEYAHLWLATAGRPTSLAEVFDHVAVTNHVKCSPESDPRGRSRPNEVMWSRCGRHVLVEELRILGARRVLLVGTSWNAWAFREQVWPDLASAGPRVGQVELLRDRVGREVLVVPHPASFGGAARSIADDVSTAIVGCAAARPAEV